MTNAALVRGRERERGKEAKCGCVMYRLKSVKVSQGLTMPGDGNELYKTHCVRFLYGVGSLARSIRNSF